MQTGTWEREGAVRRRSRWPAWTPVLLALVLGIVWGAPSVETRQSLPFSLTYESYRDIRTNGDDTTYGQGLTHRYVDGELRLLTLAYPARLHEFRIEGTRNGDLITSTTASWNLAPTGALNNFNGIWFEQAKNRLWIASAEDYTAVAHEAKITTLVLGENGTISGVRTVRLEGVAAKRVYGGCAAVPSAFVSQLGGPYVCGWGGYTSLLNNGGGASIGATMYAIADPSASPHNARVPARTVLDHFGARGSRKTLPVNRFDDGAWLSPNDDGLGWMVWGDSYYNTGMWIGSNYVAVASLCRGECWYQDSTLQFTGRQFELHVWNGASLGTNPIERPTAMMELVLPRGNTRVWEGNVTAGNIAGATYDATTRRLYLIGFPLGPDSVTGRLYSFQVEASGAISPGPGEAVVSEWSTWRPTTPWTPCSGGTQTRQEERTRAVVTPPVNDGATPALSETRQTAQACSGAESAKLVGHLIVEGLQAPVGLVPHPTESAAFLLPSRGGRVRLLRDGRVETTDFLDLSSSISDRPGGGLLGLAFAPDFSQSRRVFLSFTDRAGDFVVARFLSPASGSPRVDPASRFDLAWPDGARSVRLPHAGDFGGGLAFGDDGFLYISIGDPASDLVGAAQRRDQLLGKVLRIDVSVSSSDTRGYRVPSANPFVGTPDALAEVWALGLREPQTLAVDLVSLGGRGTTVISDRGPDLRQELNVQSSGLSGLNLGWPYREGTIDRGIGESAADLVNPSIDYGPETGRRLVSGLFYRGRALGPAFVGRYFFADAASSRVWSVGVDSTSSQFVEGSLLDHTNDLAAAAASPFGFGRDAAGELYIVGSGGSVFRIDAAVSGRGRNSPRGGRAQPRGR